MTVLNDETKDWEEKIKFFENAGKRLKTALKRRAFKYIQSIEEPWNSIIAIVEP
jgi:hypothetical protein